ncbi:hypothetical protein HPB50_010415 [Hyalomma asiaticum]|uniref:Uncharacterized protein n=1 Tax=Hyalomma asiaticum TaxID=266040 RepID=A0ACB7RTH5_HYAAI|nr:hypothetical protein HPB50_010415 [Hyalomma asiaticum]
MLWLAFVAAPAALLLALFAYNRLSTRRCRCTTDMSGKTVVITGANTGEPSVPPYGSFATPATGRATCGHAFANEGWVFTVALGTNTRIGYETARELALRGASLVLGCRSEERARRAVEQLASETCSEDISWLPLDTSSPDSVRAFVERLLELTRGRVHVLINNAGAAADTEGRRLTAEGHELTWATNYLGHYLLTRLLLRLRSAWAPGRAYCNSKRAMVLFSAELARRLQSDGVSACAVHPGVVNTPVSRGLTRVGQPWFGWLSTLFGVKNAREACQTSVHAAVAPDPCSGWYLSECRAQWPAIRSPEDERDASRLWKISELSFSTLPPVTE